MTSEEDLLTYRLLDEVLSLCHQNKWPVIAVSLEVEGERFEKLKSLFEARDVHLMRMPSQEERPDLFYEVDGHWNTRGHAYVADLIVRELNKLDPAAL